MLSPMGRNAFFCCQRFSVSVDDVLHFSAAGVVKHCQNEVTAESITLAAVLFELLCITDESYRIEFDNSTIIIDYIDSICLSTVMILVFIVNVVCLCLCSFSTRFSQFIIECISNVEACFGKVNKR